MTLREHSNLKMDSVETSSIKSNKENVIKMFKQDFEHLILPDKLLDQFYLHLNGYIFSSNLSVYQGLNKLSLPDLMEIEEPFFAFGQPPGHGFNSYEFVIYYADQKRVFMLNIPYGGIYTDNEGGAKIINEAFQKVQDLVSNSPNPPDNAKVGFFYKNRLGFSPYFFVDRKTYDFINVEN